MRDQARDQARDQLRDSIERLPSGFWTEFKRQQESLVGRGDGGEPIWVLAVEKLLFGRTESSLTGIFEKEKNFTT